MKISMVGAGHWGLALASVLAHNKHQVLIYDRSEEAVNNINNYHKSNYIENYKFSDLISATTNIDEMFSFSDYVVVVIPIVAIIPTLEKYIKTLDNKKYLIASKGLYNSASMSELFAKINDKVSVSTLSGPSFASEVIECKYTAVVVASKIEEDAKKFQELFSCEYFRIYTSNDIIGVEYCGAIKNVFAIICGMIDGANLGTNTKNAMITRGLNEMKNVINFVGGNVNTLYGLAGIGDIMLTCNSLESRNYSYGYEYTSKKASKASGVIEGLNTVKEIYKFANDNNLDMPIVNALYDVLFNNMNIKDAAMSLMTRELKKELN